MSAFRGSVLGHRLRQLRGRVNCVFPWPAARVAGGLVVGAVPVLTAAGAGVVVLADEGREGLAALRVAAFPDGTRARPIHCSCEGAVEFDHASSLPLSAVCVNVPEYW